MDDCIIMDYGRILTQQPLQQILQTLHRYSATVPEGYEPQLSDTELYHPAAIRKHFEVYSFLPPDEVKQRLMKAGVPMQGELNSESLNLEDAFIGLTGKY